MLSSELNPLKAPSPIDSTESETTKSTILVKPTQDPLFMFEPLIVNLVNPFGTKYVLNN